MDSSTTDFDSESTTSSANEQIAESIIETVKKEFDIAKTTISQKFNSLSQCNNVTITTKGVVSLTKCMLQLKSDINRVDSYRDLEPIRSVTKFIENDCINPIVVNAIVTFGHDREEDIMTIIDDFIHSVMTELNGAMEDSQEFTNAITNIIVFVQGVVKTFVRKCIDATSEIISNEYSDDEETESETDETVPNLHDDDNNNNHMDSINKFLTKFNKERYELCNTDMTKFINGINECLTNAFEDDKNKPFKIKYTVKQINLDNILWHPDVTHVIRKYRENGIEIKINDFMLNMDTENVYFVISHNTEGNPIIICVNWNSRGNAHAVELDLEQDISV